MKKSITVIVLVAGASIGAQAQNVSPHFEVGGFGGGQFWKSTKTDDYPLPKKLATGPVLGGRIGYDFSPRWGVDSTFAWGWNDASVQLRPGAGVGRVEFGARNFQWMAGPMFYLTDRYSRVRPYLSAGPALQRFWPTDEAKQQALGLRSLPIGAVNLDDNFTGGLYYGGGVKAWLTRNWNARFDIRGILSGNPHIRYRSQHAVPDPLALPAGSVGHGLMATVGLGYAIGSPGWDDGAPAKTFGVKITAPDGEVYQGDPATFKAQADAVKGPVTYAWRVNDQASGTGPSVTVDTSKLPPGKYPVEVQANAGKLAPARDMATLTVLQRQPKDMSVVILGAPSGAVYPGDKIAFSARTQPAAPNVKFEWKVDGQPAPIGEQLELNTGTLAPGNHTVAVEAKAEGFKTAVETSTFTLARPTPPQITLSVPSEVKAGEMAPITASATRGPGGGNPGSVNLAASEGAIRNGQLDTSTVQFDPSATGQQRKPVTITASVTDDKGLSASRQATVTVVKQVPPAVRLADVVFPRNSGRVNNCGKRVLLEELKAYIDRDPTGKVILISHSDKGEAAVARRQRGRNAAAVLTAGTGICLGIDPNRVLLGFANNGEGSQPQPYLCGTSTRPKTRERSGSAVGANDARALNRRVEVWFVPSGGVMPSGLGELKTAAELNVRTVGCPR